MGLIEGRTKKSGRGETSSRRDKRAMENKVEQKRQIYGRQVSWKKKRFQVGTAGFQQQGSDDGKYKGYLQLFHGRKGAASGGTKEVFGIPCCSSITVRRNGSMSRN